MHSQGGLWQCSFEVAVGRLVMQQCMEWWQCGSTHKAPAVSGGVVEWDGVGRNGDGDGGDCSGAGDVQVQSGQGQGAKQQFGSKISRMLSELA